MGVIGPTGGLIRLADLPPANTARWVARRKAEVVAAVRGGLISLEEALRRYQLTLEEFESWRGGFEAAGMAGLRTTQRPARAA
jgi:hypothetical protein